MENEFENLLVNYFINKKKFEIFLTITAREGYKFENLRLLKTGFDYLSKMNLTLHFALGTSTYNEFDFALL